MPKGKYLVLEGGDGVGKSTQALLLREALQRAGIQTETFREPGGDPMGEAIRSLILGDLQLETKAEMFLFNAARVQATKKAQELLEQGIWAIGDRNYLSTMAYQCHARGLDPGVVREICRYAIEGAEPDLMLLLTVSRDVALARRGLRQLTDRFEAETEEFHRKVDEGYLIEAKLYGIPVIDASPAPEKVHARIWEHVEPLLKGI